MWKIITKKYLDNGDCKTRFSNGFVSYKMAQEILSKMSSDTTSCEIRFVPDDEWFESLMMFCKEARNSPLASDYDLRSISKLERMLAYMAGDNARKATWLHNELEELAKDLPMKNNRFLKAANELNHCKVNEFRKGDWVAYTGSKVPCNGRVKSIKGDNVFVVFNCGSDWDLYNNYTAEMVKSESLALIKEE